MAVQTYNLGTVTAYGDAKAGGYTGTLAEWQALMASYATVGQQAVQGAQTATTKAEEALTSAESAEIAKIAAEAAQQVAEAAQQVAEAAAEEAMNALVTDSASGGIAHFVDGADNVPLKSLKVNIEPVQSGSGNPSPTNIRPITGWRAVKATRTGKNLAAPLATGTGTYSGKVVTYEENSRIIITGETTSGNSDTPNKYFGGSTSAPINLESGKTYTLSVQGKFEVSHSSVAVPEVRVRLMDAGNAFIWSDNNAEGKWTFTPESDFVADRFMIRFARQGTVIDVDGYLQFEVGSEATEYEPYSGDVYKVLLSDGENRFDINSVYADDSKFTIVGDSVSGTATDFASTSFTIPSELVGNTLRFSIYAEVGETPNYIRVSATVAGLTYNGESIEATTSGSSSVLFTPTSTDDEVKIVYGSLGTGVITVSKIRLEVANFVYGGTLDVVSGKLTIDRASVVMDGSSDEGWYAMTTANIFRANAITPTPASGATAEDFSNHPIVSNCTNTSRYNYNLMKAAYPCVSFNDQGRLYLAISADTTTIEQALAWLAQNNLQIVYYLATPVTYQLSATEINSLLGVNNIWSDVGDVDVAYKADTKFYIDKTNPLVDTTLSIAGKAADAKKVGDELADVKEDLSEYEGIFTADVDESVQNWLDEHPEATTTVQDGAITEAKLNSEVTEKLLSDYYYPEITSWQERLYDTTCYFVSVPVRDSDGNIINPYLKYETALTPLGHAIANHTTFTCNGTTGCLQNGSIVRGHVISRGRSVYNNTLTSVKNTFRYVSINADRTVTDYAVNNTTQADMLGDGAYNVFCAYYKLIDNGTIVDNSATVNNENNNVSTSYLPYSAIGVMSDNALLFMAADGRTDIDKGLNSVNAANILLDKGCVNAWAMDGGGSVSYNVRGAKYNRNIDNDGTTDRLVHISLNFKKDSKSDSVTEAFGKIGEEKQNVVKQVIPYINDLYDKHDSLINNEGITSGTDLNTITANGRYAATTTAVATSLTNCPTSVAFMMEIIKISSTMSFYVILDYNSDIYVRRNYVYSNANHFSAWKKVTTE